MAKLLSFSVRVKLILRIVVVGIVPAAVLELDGGVVSQHEVHQKRRKDAHGNGKCERQDQHEYEVEQEVGGQFVLLVHEEAVHLVDGKDQKPGAKRSDVAQALNEELVVSEPDATSKPRAMVVHLENAPLTVVAVMAPVRFPGVAHVAQLVGWLVITEGMCFVNLGRWNSHLRLSQRVWSGSIVR